MAWNLVLVSGPRPHKITGGNGGDVTANPCGSWASNISPLFLHASCDSTFCKIEKVLPEGTVLGIAETKSCFSPRINNLGTFRVDCPKSKAYKRALLVGLLHRFGCPLRQDGKCALTLEQYAEVLFCAVASLVSWRVQVQRSNDIETQKEWED